MTERDARTTEKSFAHCENCGNEVAVLKTDGGELVRPHEECQECGAATFTEVPADDLDDLSEFSEWADEEHADERWTDSGTADAPADDTEPTEADE